MAGNRTGGLKAAATNKARYGADFYKVQGRKGGAASNTGGFAANRELAREAGRKGGMVSKRRRKTKGETWNDQNLTSTSSTSSTPEHAHTCRNCLKLEFVDEHGWCERCREWEAKQSEALQALLDETYEIDKGNKISLYETVTVKKSGIKGMLRKLGL